MARANARFRFDIGKLVKALEASTTRQVVPLAKGIGAEMVDHARALTATRLTNNRPENRRNSGAGKAHYIDSFKLGAPDTSGGRVRIVFYNDHPGARPIEEGTPPHKMTGPMKFPVATMRPPGLYATPAGSLPERRIRRGQSIMHPGTPPQLIVKETRDWAKANFRSITVRVEARLSR